MTAPWKLRPPGYCPSGKPCPYAAYLVEGQACQCTENPADGRPRKPIVRTLLRKLITPAGYQEPRLGAELMVAAAKCITAGVELRTSIDFGEMYIQASTYSQEFLLRYAEATGPKAESLKQTAERYINIAKMAQAAADYAARLEDLGI